MVKTKSATQQEMTEDVLKELIRLDVSMKGIGSQYIKKVASYIHEECFVSLLLCN